MFGLMRKDDRIHYVGKQVWVVLAQGRGDRKNMTDLLGAYMSQDKARRHTAEVRENGGYAWYRDAIIQD